MMRSISIGALLVAVGAAAGFVFSERTPTEPAPHELRVPPSSFSVARTSPPVLAQGDTWSRGFGTTREIGGAGRHLPAVERRLERLESRLEEEAAERRRLEEQLAELEARLATSGGPNEASTSGAPLIAPPPAAPVPVNDVAANAPIDYVLSPMERALTAAGLDAEAAADIKYRQDSLAMSEMYLRDQATREQWMDTPRYAEEMAKIDAERTSVRDEIGDDAYDRYLFALGQTNRVRVDDVLSESPAAQVGLQSGDLILRYGETRIFAPRDLVDETHGGSLGESVRLEVVRNGERFEVEVPRGPLGLRVAADQDTPDAS